MTAPGLRARLGRLFIAQIAIIGIATVVGIYLTELVVEDMLTRRALTLEAEHYWRLAADNPDLALPHTANMRGYLAGARDPLPRGFENLGPGFGRVAVDGIDRLVHISDRGDERLYLVFDEAGVSDLAFYFGLLPLSIVLLLMYLLLFIAYRWSQRALSPIVRLARQLQTLDFEASGHVALELGALRRSTNAEVATMVDALDQLAARINAAIDRERVFTRDAGHELRTPVAVFKGSLDLLETAPESHWRERDQQALRRMRRTVEDMETLLETLLLLARGEAGASVTDETSVNEVVSLQIDELRALADEKSNTVTLHEAAELRVRAPVKVVQIVIGNLLRNALTYTANGTVDVTVAADAVKVADTGPGMSRPDLANAFEPFYRADTSRGTSRGHGLGLSIVRRLSQQFGWQLAANSRLGEGTTMEVHFG